MCKKESENLDHIFITCEFTQDLRNKVGILIQWQLTHDSIKSICKGICLINQKYAEGVITFILILVHLCSIWPERNQIIFKDKGKISWRDLG